MIGPVSPAEERLVSLLVDAARGPKRDGLFAVWLMVRCAEGLLPPSPVSLRNHRRRLAALEARLFSLTLPAPLKRALAAARTHLDAGTCDAAALVLFQLAAPVRETLGSEAGEAVALAARTARDLARAV